MKIGICGGTFDPIHLGHLAVAELVRSEFDLDKILFVPSGMPPHKNLKNVTAPIHRLNMVKCAVSSNPYFEAISIEVDRSGYTYTVDTLKELQGLYPRGTEFYYIIGADVVMDLLSWRNAPEVFKLTNFIAVMRPGFSNEAFKERLIFLRSKYEANIRSFEIPLLEISSTFVRERIKEKKSIKYLVDKDVEEYIIKNHLYL
ncbi:MAG: nicotinate/nicotinamide nucleotide adenylyltransferase [Eubacterium sp.]|nr:nicotinate/nicotinamide nucleotide adenylyltransferase [Eubacterium sp.]